MFRGERPRSPHTAEVLPSAAAGSPALFPVFCPLLSLCLLLRVFRVLSSPPLFMQNGERDSFPQRQWVSLNYQRLLLRSRSSCPALGTSGPGQRRLEVTVLYEPEGAHRPPPRRSLPERAPQLLMKIPGNRFPFSYVTGFSLAFPCTWASCSPAERRCPPRAQRWGAGRGRPRTPEH